MKRKLLVGGGVAAGLVLLAASPALAQDVDRTLTDENSIIQSVVLDNIFIFICDVLVFLMQAGFAMLEAGFTQAKNAVNIMMKNIMDFSIGSIAYFVLGFGIMFGATESGWSSGTTPLPIGDARKGSWVLSMNSRTSFSARA